MPVPAFRRIAPAMRTPLGIILVGGGFGGFTSTFLPPIGDPIVTDWIAATFLGAVAALLFVVVISNTDRSDAVRLLAISVIAGITWQPTILGLREAQRSTVLRRDMASLADTVAALNEAQRTAFPEDDTQKPEYLSAVGEAFEAAVTSANRVVTDTAQTTAGALLSSAFDSRSSSELALVEALGLEEIDLVHSPMLPDLQDVDLVLMLGSPLVVEEEDRTEAFVRFDIPAAAQYTVDVTSEDDRDLVAAIHRVDEPVTVAVNDDSGDSLNPSITEALERGTYYLHLRDFYGNTVASFTASLVRTQGGDN